LRACHGRRASENESVHTALSAGRYPERKAGLIMQLESTLTCPHSAIRSWRQCQPMPASSSMTARAAECGLSASLAVVAYSAPMARSRVRRSRAMAAAARLRMLADSRVRAPLAVSPSITERSERDRRYSWMLGTRQTLSGSRPLFCCAELTRFYTGMSADELSAHGRRPKIQVR
jgi:hypothetical protein